MDDREDAEFLVKKYNFITDQTSEVLEKIIPKLEELADKNKGVELKLFDMNENHSGRYPRRKMKFQPTSEDKSIFVGGIHIGYVKMNIPWLHPKYWSGFGIGFDNMPRHLELQEEQRMAKLQWKQEYSQHRESVFQKKKE